MKRSRRTAATIGAVALFAGATGAADVSQRDVLSGIDVVITTTLIEDLFFDPFVELVALAHNPNEDAGVRLRCYRALSLYPAAASVLATDIQDPDQIPTSPETDPGTKALLLRAAIEALGELQRSLGSPENYEVLIQHLSHPSRDIRAATADALRVMGATGAIDALYDRLAVETSEQVDLAITDALRELNGLLPP